MVVKVGGGSPLSLAAKMEPRPVELRDKEARSEPAMGQLRFDDASGVLSGGGRSAGSSDT